MNPLGLLTLLGIGALEWGLAIRRAVYAARGKRWRCSMIVFGETLLAIYVLRTVVVDSSWLPALFYAGGGAAGAWWASR